MRYLILSDIHANLEALQACIRRAEQATYDSVLCCGDIVGYGPNPIEAIDVIRDLNGPCIRGNHDRVAAGLDEADQFNPHARRAVYWTRSVLTESHRDYLSRLPIGPLSISHFGQLPAVTINFNLKPGYSLGQAAQQVDNAIRDLRMPADGCSTG